MITEIEAKLNEMEKAPELAAIPETVPEMTAHKAARASESSTRQMALVMKAARDREKSRPLSAPGKRLQVRAVRQMNQMKYRKRIQTSRKAVFRKPLTIDLGLAIRGLWIWQNQRTCRRSISGHCRK